MDWIRRNWPDLLIGVALVAVIALIVATLLSGGSLTSLLQRSSAPPPITNTTGSATPGTTTDAASGTNGNGTSAPADTTTPSGATTGAATSNTGVDVFVPDVPGGQANAGADGGNTDTPAAGAAGGQPSTPATQTGQNGGAATVNVPLPQSVPNGGFRVAAGAVGTRDGATTLAQDFRDNGYTTTIEQQGDLYLLWVGPYASEAGAERVAERLIADGQVPDALVYTYDGSAPANAAGAGNNAASGTQATGTQATGTQATGTQATGTQATGTQATGTQATGAQTTGTQATGTQANSAAANPTPTSDNANAGAGNTAATATTQPSELNAPAGQQFLQVGAFVSGNSAAPQRQQLEQLGLDVTTSEDESGLVRLFVGPFGAPQLAQTRTRLTAQGIDSFPVTP